MNNSLSGKKVLLTCEKELGEEFSNKLKDSGAGVFVLPAIEIKPVDDWSDIDRHISGLNDYDWLIFTSQHAVKYFFERMEKLKPGNYKGIKARIAAVGESTKNLIEKNKHPVSFIPEKFTSDDLAKTLPGISGRKILFPHGDKISRGSIEELKKRGGVVDELIVYKNENALSNKVSPDLLSERFDFIVFMSSSAVKNFKSFISKTKTRLNYSIIIAIGPETELAARAEFQGVIKSDVHTMDGILKKMLQNDLSPAKTTR